MDRIPRRGLLRTTAALGALLRVPAVAPRRGRQRPSRAVSWWPRPPARPGRLLVVDLDGTAPETQAAAAILQGLVNARAAPGEEALYLVVPRDYAGGVAFWGADPWWADAYARRYGIPWRSGGLSDAVALARARGVTRYVVWDPALPATVDVANTLAWRHGWAAVAPSDAPPPLLGPAALVAASALGGALAAHGFQLALDLRSLAFADAEQAYRWALRALGTERPETLALLAVGDLPGDPTEGVLRWTPRDYAVTARAFCWIAPFAGGPPPLFAEAVRALGDRPSLAFGWTDDEDEQTIACSRAGLLFVGADTPGLPAENLSVHTAVPAEARQRAPADPGDPDPRGVYATLVFTDGDNVSVLIGLHEGRWLDPARGRVPVGWSLQGMAPAWTPALAATYFDQATPHDEFVAWLPYGYPDLPSFVGQPRWPVYVATAQAALRSAGLRVAQTLPHTGQVLDADALGLRDLLQGPEAPEGFFLGYTALLGYPVGQPLWVAGRPVFAVGAGPVPPDASPSAAAARALAQALRALPDRPLFFVVGLGNGTRYADAVRVAEAAYPEPVRFVLPSQLVALAARARARGLLAVRPLGASIALGPPDAFFLREGGDLGTGSALGVAAAAGAWRYFRYARPGGGWRYGFDLTGARRATLALVLAGDGTVAVGTEDGAWTPVARGPGAWRPAAQTVDLGAWLRAGRIRIRFAPGATVLAAAEATVRLEAAASPSAAGILLPPLAPPQVSYAWASPPELPGLVPVGAHQGDSLFHLAEVGGRLAAVFDPNTVSPANPVTYLYFLVNAPGWRLPADLRLTVTYYDAPAGGRLHASYNGPGSGLPGAYASAGEPVVLTGAGGWRQASWTLAGAAFRGAQNFGADLRVSGTPGVAVAEVAVGLG